MTQVNRTHLAGLLLANELLSAIAGFEQDKLDDLIAKARSDKTPLYKHINSGEVERLTVGFVKELDKVSERNYQLRMQLAEADQKISTVIKYVRAMVKAAGNQPSVATGYLHDILESLLSATTQPNPNSCNCKSGKCEQWYLASPVKQFTENPNEPSRTIQTRD